MINFSDIDKHQDESIHRVIISNEIEYGSVEDPLSMHRTGSNETAIVSEILYVINDENIIIAPGQEKKSVSILSDEFLPKDKFGYKAIEIFQ